jgi:3-dehydroquinate synthase II
MRELWVEVDRSLPTDLKREMLTAAEQIDVALVANEDIELFKASGLRIASPSEGDMRIIDETQLQDEEVFTTPHEPTVVRFTVENREDEARAIQAIEKDIDYILVSCPDWLVIPLENLIAKAYGKVKLLAQVNDLLEARVALEALQLGVDGVVVKTGDLEELKRTARLLETVRTRTSETASPHKVDLQPATVTAVRQVGLGSRACIDTCDILTLGEGMLVGPQSSALFLLQAEVEESPFIEPRPFRVNAGPVSLYILTPGEKTKYLAELKAGDEVLAISRDGDVRTVIIGRVKIEKRPLMLVEAELHGKDIKTIVQNAETIRFVTHEGSKSVTELREGDTVLVYHQTGGRHFGVLVSEESIIER